MPIPSCFIHQSRRDTPQLLQVALNFQENISLQVTRKHHHLCGLHVRVKQVLGQVAAAFQASDSTLDMLACSSSAQFRPEKQSSVNPGSGTSSTPGLAVGLVWSLISARTRGGQRRSRCAQEACGVGGKE